MNSPPVVAVTDHVFPNLDPERGILAPLGVELREGQCKTAEEVAAHTRGADAVLVCYAPLPAQVIQGLGGCRIIARYGIGVDNVDVTAATETGIVVTNVPDYCIDEVSDHALALILALARRVATADRRVRRGEWSVPGLAPMHRLRGRTLGLVALGKIARALATKVQALGMEVIAHDPYLPPAQAADLGVGLVSFDDLLSQSDIVSLHAPLTEETRSLINATTIAKMKPGAFLINTARGGLVDICAVAEALESGRLGGAALDVLPTEPPPPDSPLLTLENVILTPHTAFYSEESLVELQTKAAEEVARALTGQRPRAPVNPEVLGRVTWL